MRKFFPVLLEALPTAAALTPIYLIYSKVEMERNTIIFIFLILWGASTALHFLVKNDRFWDWIEKTFGKTPKEGELWKSLFSEGLFREQPPMQKWEKDMHNRQIEDIIKAMRRKLK